MIRTIASLFLVLSWIPAFIAFLLHFRSPNKESVYWKFVFALLFCILSILTVSVVRFFHPGTPMWFDWLRFALYFTLPFVLWWLVFLMIRARRKEKDDDIRD